MKGNREEKPGTNGKNLNGSGNGQAGNQANQDAMGKTYAQRIPKPRMRNRKRTSKTWKFVQYIFLFFVAGSLTLFVFLPGQFRSVLSNSGFRFLQSGAVGTAGTGTSVALQGSGTPVGQNIAAVEPSITPFPTSTKNLSPQLPLQCLQR